MKKNGMTDIVALVLVSEMRSSSTGSECFRVAPFTLISLSVRMKQSFEKKP